MKKFILLFVLVLFMLSCGNYEYLYSKQYRAIDIISMPEMLKDKYGYLFLAHEKRIYAFGGEPDVFEHLVLDNCRKAGIYYTDTFTIVKLLPGRHSIRIVRPPKAYIGNNLDPNVPHNFAHFILNVKGGEVFVYDDTRGWTDAMKMVKKDINHLKDLKVSIDCYDCFEDPIPEKVFDFSCMR
jgi:hypothetical protein